MNPTYFAIAPEVHSALISAGPGPGSLLAAGNAWAMLHAEYRTAAAELEAILSTVRATVWDGSAADRYLTAHQPVLRWLEQAALGSSTSAQLHFDAAAAYSAALAEIPSVAEIALNRSTHAALISTNFLGINTIPLTVNETDYQRMWLQAASAMTAYDQVAGLLVQNLPAHPGPPQITALLTPPGAAAASADSTSGRALEAGNALERSNTLVSRLIELLRVLAPPIASLLEELTALDWQNLLPLLLTNPSAALAALAPLGAAFLGYVIFQTIGFIFWGSVLSPFLALVPALAIPLAVELLERAQHAQESEAPAETPTQGALPSGRGTENPRMTPLAPLGGTPSAPGSPSAPTPQTMNSVSSPPPSNVGPAMAFYILASSPEGPPGGPGPRLGGTDTDVLPSFSSNTVSAAAKDRDLSAARRRRLRRAKKPEPRQLRPQVATQMSPGGSPPAVSDGGSAAGRAGSQGVHSGEATPRGLLELRAPGPLDTAVSEPMLPTTWPENSPEKPGDAP